MSISSQLSLSKKVLLFFIHGSMYVLAHTLRIRYEKNAESFIKGETHQQNESSGSLLLFWHNQLLLVYLLTIIHKKKLPPFTAMVSSNRNIDLFAALLEKSGYAIVRGSANNKSIQALKGAHKAIQKKHLIFIAADGPTGPIYQIKPGAAFLSDKYQVPIDLLDLKPSQKITFKTWDQLMLPMPFSKIRLNWLRVVPSELGLDLNGPDSKNSLNQSLSILQDKMQSISGDLMAK